MREKTWRELSSCVMFRYLLMNDLMFVAERDVETHIWKTVYYQVIEMLKSAYLDSENTTAENRKTLKSCLINLFDEGVDYYTQLLTDLSTTYRYLTGLISLLQMDN